MRAADPRVEAYFAGAQIWPGELAELRRALLDSPLTETFKWRSPCYTYDDANVATVWDFKDACTLGFFKGVLLKDAAGILTAQGEHSRAMRVARFTSPAEIRALEPVLQEYIREAIAIEAAGLRVDFPKDDLDLPGELAGRLEADGALRAAFAALTPGRQRAYVLHFAQPRQSATRAARIEKHVPRILAGKGLNDR